MDSKDKIRLIIRESIRERMQEASLAQQVMSLFHDPRKQQNETIIGDIIASAKKGQELVGKLSNHADALIKIRLSSLRGIFQHCEKIAQALAEDDFSASFIDELAHTVETHAERFSVIIKNIGASMPDVAQEFQKYWETIYSHFQEFYHSKH